MREIKYIVIHCTATQQNTTVESILRYWKEKLKWENPGYHFIIKTDGEVVNLLPIEEVSNGVQGFNHECINIAYIGGIDDKGKAIDNRTPEQVKAMKNLIDSLWFNGVIVQGHRDFPNVHKNCPSFDVKKWYYGK